MTNVLIKLHRMVGRPANFASHVPLSSVVLAVFGAIAVVISCLTNSVASVREPACLGLQHRQDALLSKTSHNVHGWKFGRVLRVVLYRTL
jgi:hypothetical protein